jgi:hypothetical protein
MSTSMSTMGIPSEEADSSSCSPVNSIGWNRIDPHAIHIPWHADLEKRYETAARLLNECLISHHEVDVFRGSGVPISANR